MCIRRLKMGNFTNLYRYGRRGNISYSRSIVKGQIIKTKEWRGKNPLRFQYNRQVRYKKSSGISHTFSPILELCKSLFQVAKAWNANADLSISYVSHLTASRSTTGKRRWKSWRNTSKRTRPRGNANAFRDLFYEEAPDLPRIAGLLMRVNTTSPRLLSGYSSRRGEKLKMIKFGILFPPVLKEGHHRAYGWLINTFFYFKTPSSADFSKAFTALSRCPISWAAEIWTRILPVPWTTG